MGLVFLEEIKWLIQRTNLPDICQHVVCCIVYWHNIWLDFKKKGLNFEKSDEVIGLNRCGESVSGFAEERREDPWLPVKDNGCGDDANFTGAVIGFACDGSDDVVFEFDGDP